MSRHKQSSSPPARSSRYYVIISGYYGFGNYGDELILQILVEHFKALEQFEVIVLSNNPDETAQQYDVKSINRWDVFAVIEELSRAHLFISGGGGLLQDKTGLASPLYYGGLIHLARFFQIPTFFFAQGVGPLHQGLSKWMTKTALSRCQGVTVRDEASAKLVHQLTDFWPQVTADPAWLLSVPNRRSARKKTKKWNIALSLRPWKDLTSERIVRLAAFFKRLTSDSELPVQFYLLNMQPESDSAVLQAFESALAQEGLPECCHWVEPDEIMKTITKCHVLFGMRYHSLILGLLAHVPVYGLIYDEKVDNLLQRLHLSGCKIPVLEYLEEEAVRIYFAHYQEPNLDQLKEEALINFQLLMEVFQLEVEDTLVGLEDSL